MIALARNLPSPFRRRPRRARGFSLIEILVVLLVIVVLMGILIPGVVLAVKAAKRKKTEATMMAVQNALEAYKADHRGQYPKTLGALNTGFAVLGRELAGTYGNGVDDNSNQTPAPPDPKDPPTHNPSNVYNVGECVQQGSLNNFVCLVDQQSTGKVGAAVTDTTAWAAFNPLDGLDGPGGKPANKKYGPYVEQGKFNIRGCAILDADGRAILYFPATGNPIITKPTPTGASFVGSGAGPKFNVNDNIQFFVRPDDSGTQYVNAAKRIAAMMGDYDPANSGAATNFDGIIDGNEGAVYNGSYILWAPGPDGLYGPKQANNNAPSFIPSEISKCDDVIVPHQ
jgi:prepilin-type N-terminal cleavage/methylation domain-containing protein